MKVLFQLLIFVALQELSFAKVIIQSDLNGETISPSGIVSSHTHSQSGIINIDGAQVIWGQNWDKTPVNQTIKISETFKIFCSAPLRLRIAGNVFYSIHFNGLQVYNQTGDKKSSRSILKGLKCEQNLLQIQAKNLNVVEFPGIIYQIDQEQNCLQCQLGSYFNQQKCQCECLRDCSCSEPRIQWHSYPHCRCGCEKKNCDNRKIQNQLTCECQCLQRNKCSENEIRNENCQCEQICFRQQCPAGFWFNEEICQCVCEKRECNPRFFFDNNKCGCFCEKKQCPPGFRFNEEICQCVCEKRECHSGFFFDSDKCGCFCEKKTCPPRQSVNQNTCNCECIVPFCPKFTEFNPESCRCTCQNLKENFPSLCPSGFIFDDLNCQCKCETGFCVENCELKECQAFEIWNQQYCSCIPIRQNP